MKQPFDERDADAPATPEELEQADALARALEGHGKGPGPELETAALLRQARGGEIPDVRAQVLPALTGRRPRRLWLWPALLIPMAAAVLLLGTATFSLRAPAPVHVRAVVVRVPAAPAPPPTSSLLAAQAKAARGDRQALAALEDEMRRYRAAFYRGPEAR
jgi:hypothetical protein